MKYGWPNIENIGYKEFSHNLDLFLIIIHAKETDFLWFLEHIVKQCYLGNENWISLRPLFSNILLRYKYGNGYVPLRFIYDNESSISKLQEESILKNLEKNKSRKIQIMPYNSHEIYLANKLLEYLIHNNINPNRIEITCNDESIENDNILPLPKLLVRFL